LLTASPLIWPLVEFATLPAVSVVGGSAILIVAPLAGF
jgi:hypothetical protein